MAGLPRLTDEREDHAAGHDQHCDDEHDSGDPGGSQHKRLLLDEVEAFGVEPAGGHADLEEEFLYRIHHRV
jgi:hypothetical protein